MKPKVLVSVSKEKKLSYWKSWLSDRTEAAYTYGTAFLSEDTQALILAGGSDVIGTDPCYAPDPLRDSAEKALLRQAVARRLPILGVCRGHQLIQYALGGRLISALPGEKHLDYRTHPVRCCPGSRLFGLFGGSFSVNSSHHQAVESPGEGMKAVCFSEDGVIEACEHDLLPILTVQWHPERMNGQSALLSCFLSMIPS